MKRANTTVTMKDVAREAGVALTYHINLALLQRKYKMQLYSTDSDPEREQTYINMMQQNRVDGIIGLTYNSNLIIDEDMPFIALERSIGPDFPCVVSDEPMGTEFIGFQMPINSVPVGSP